MGVTYKIRRSDRFMSLSSIHYNRYITFIYSRRFREIDEGVYTEKHHIIPKSLNGTNNNGNLIELTLREHYIAHLILWKIFYGPNYLHKGWILGRLEFSQETKKKMAENHIGMIGLTHSKESKIKIRDGGKNRGMYGKYHTVDTKKKQSESHRGKKWINNGNIEKCIDLEKLLLYSSEWVLGRLYKRRTSAI